jgi:hypothetical protein
VNASRDRRSAARAGGGWSERIPTMPSVPTHMVEVYKAAWTRAEGSGDFTDGVFLDVLASSNVAAAYSERDKFETARDLYLGLWRQQVPPDRLAKHLKRALRRELFTGIKDVLSGWRGVPRWMIEPGDVELIGADDWSLPLRELDFEVTPAAQAHWKRVLEYASAHRDEDDGTMLVDCWLRITASPETTSVLVGREPVGVTPLTPEDWQALTDIAREGRVSHGTLTVDDTDPERPPRMSISAFMPREN